MLGIDCALYLSSRAFLYLILNYSLVYFTGNRQEGFSQRRQPRWRAQPTPASIYTTYNMPALQ